MALFQMPESVVRYTEDKALQAAIEFLLASAPSKMDSYGWEDVPNYYRAYLAAQQCRAEWAETLHRLWEELWREPDRALWRPLSPDEQAKLGWSVDLETMWKRVMLARIFVSRALPKRFLYLAVATTPAYGIQLGFGAYSDDDEELLSAPEGFVTDEDDRLHWTPERAVIAQEQVDLAPLRAATSTVWEAVARLLP
jgi:hypothetical protein